MGHLLFLSSCAPAHTFGCSLPLWSPGRTEGPQILYAGTHVYPIEPKMEKSGIQDAKLGVIPSRRKPHPYLWAVTLRTTIKQLRLELVCSSWRWSCSVFLSKGNNNIHYVYIIIYKPVNGLLLWRVWVFVFLILLCFLVCLSVWSAQQIFPLSSDKRPFVLRWFGWSNPNPQAVLPPSSVRDNHVMSLPIKVLYPPPTPALCPSIYFKNEAYAPS